MLRLWVVVAAVLVVGGVIAQEGKWYRTDGRTTIGNPALLQQFEVDIAVCRGERAKVIANGAALHSFGRQQAGEEVLVGCMAGRGYVWRADR